VFVVIPRIMEGRAYSVEDSWDSRKAVRAQADDMIGKWPVMGTGLESFEWVYPWFQPAKSSRDVMDHAENEYLQTLTDTGIVGGAITAAFLAIIAFNWVKAYRGRLPIHLASIGIAFSLTAVMVHSLADFAQRTPAIGMLSALLCAASVSLARINTRRVPAEAAPRFGFSPLPRLVAGAGLVAAMGWAIWSVQAVRMGDANYWISDPLYTGDLDPTHKDYDESLVKFFDRRITDTETALKHDPKVVQYIYYLNDFRWRKLTRQRDPKTDRVTYQEGAADQAKQIIKELSDARVVCPTYGPLYILQGKVQWELFDREQGRMLLQRGYDLKPFNPEINFYLAEVAAEENDWDGAVKWARDCFRQHRWYDRKIVDLFLKRYDQAERAFEVFKDDSYGLYFLASSVPPSNVELHARISEQSIARLTRQIETNPSDAQAMVQLAERLDAAGRKPEAVDYVAKAIVIEYGRVDWRLYKARLLRDLNRFPEAITEAELVLRSKPQSVEAKALLDYLQDPKRSRKR
jgi:tetratricopeptide (TPR) repeat protein